MIGAILVVFSIFNQPSEEQLAEDKRIRDSIALVQADTSTAIEPEKAEAVESIVDTNVQALTVLDSTLNDSTVVAQRSSDLEGKYGIFAPAAEGTEDTFTISNDLIELQIDAKGGMIKSAVLKEFQTYDSLPLQLMDPDSSSYAFRFFHGNKDLNTKDFFFEAQGSEFQISGEDNKAFRLRLNTSDPNKYIEYQYTLKGGSYMVDFNVEVVGLENDVDVKNLFMQWHMAGFNNEKSLEVERQKCTVFYKYFNDGRDYLSESSEETERLEGKTNWVAFKQNFFSAILISPTGFADGSEISILPLEDEAHTKSYEAKLYFNEAGSSRVDLPMQFYLGPNHYQTLKRTEIPELYHIIDLGWGIFGWMNEWLVIPIFNWLDGSGLSYGIIILILTIIIKMILFPLTYRNYKSSAKMKVLKPEIEEINEKFKDGDAMKKQQATMALYKKAGVNPMSGCIPMVIQMPILYAMFRFFPASIELRQESFLWADDLSSYDSIANLPFEIPLYGDHVSLFTILMAISTILYTRVNSSQMPTGGAGMPNMKMMMYIFPVMMLFIFNSFASGLSYYYFTANVISMLQMLVIKKFIINEDKIHAQIQANKAKPKKKSNFQKRLEDMQRQQEKKRRK